MGRAKMLFNKAKGFVPKASRDQSTEIYIVCNGYLGKNAAEIDSSNRSAESDALPQRKASRGWNK